MRPDAAPADMLERALALHRAGKLGEARGVYARVLAMDDSSGAAYHGLARLFMDLGAVADASCAWRKAIEVEPAEREHYLGLMDLHEREGAMDAMLELCETALSVFPDDAELVVRHGLALVAQGRHEEAVKRLQHAAENDADIAPLQNALGIALQRSGRVEQAERCFRRAIGVQPRFAAAHSNLGTSLVARGEIDNAQAALEQAVELDPHLTAAWQNLSSIKRFGPQDRPDIERVKHVLEHGELSDSERSALYFTLGKMHEDCGDYDQAFAHFTTANRLRRAELRYDPRRHEANVDRVVSLFDQRRLRRGLGGANASAIPVFILGMPRSGTTLVEQILSSHPEVHAAGELSFFDELTLRPVADQNKALNYIDCLDDLDAVTVSLLADTYLQRLLDGCAVGTIARATDKMLSNYLHLGLIHMLFPRARFVYCRRDPLDVCVSIFVHAFSDMPFAWDLHEIGGYYRQYARLMTHWQKLLGEAKILDLRYERLVADQQGVTRQLLEHCGLSWDRACVDFHRNARHVLTASDWQVRQPIYASSIHRWKRYSDHLQPLRLGLGDVIE